MFLSDIPIQHSINDHLIVNLASYSELYQRSSTNGKNKKLSAKDATLRLVSIKEEALRVSTKLAFFNSYSKLSKYILKREASLNTIFNFTPLLLSGGTILPPVIAVNNNRIDTSKDSIIRTNQSYTITSPARIVTTPPTWRSYLLSSKVSIPTIQKEILPKTTTEQKVWKDNIEAGWVLGVEQAEREFILNIRRLSSDYIGLVRYHLLLRKNMISEPFMVANNIGITNTDNNLNIGQQSFTLVQPSYFKTDYQNWDFLPNSLSD